MKAGGGSDADSRIKFGNDLTKIRGDLDYAKLAMHTAAVVPTPDESEERARRLDCGDAST